MQIFSDKRKKRVIENRVMENRVNQNCPYTSHSIDKRMFKKMSKKFLLSFYKTVLYKFFWTMTKNRVIENRVIENQTA